MSSTAPDANSLTLHGLPFVSVPSVGTGVLSITSNYTAVINNELWLVNKDPNTGGLTLRCQISLPPGYKITQDQPELPPGHPNGRDKVPPHLYNTKLKNIHLLQEPMLASEGVTEAFVIRWLGRKAQDVMDAMDHEYERSRDITLDERKVDEELRKKKYEKSIDRMKHREDYAR